MTPFGRLALDGVNLHVERGSVFGFLGANGAGKTVPLLAASALWVVLATLLIAVSLLASAAFDAMAAAAGVGIFAFFLLAVDSAAAHLSESTPAGLLPAAVSVASGTLSER